MSVNSSKNIETIVKYVKTELEHGRFPRGNELHKKFRIYSHGLNIGDIYGAIGINLLLLPKKPANSRKIIQELLIDYIKSEIKKKHYPTHREIKNNFRVDLLTLFPNGIRELYEKAEVEYKLSPNQDIKYKKAETMIELAKRILPKINLEITNVRGVMQHGVDILTKHENEKIGVEIKAYNRHEILKTKDIEQAKTFLEKEDINKVIIMTSTSRIAKSILPKNISIMSYNDVIKLCDEKDIEILEFVRNHSINIESEDIELKRNRIIEFVKVNAKLGKLIGAREVLKELNLCVYSYFENIDELYALSDIWIPLQRVRYVKDKGLKNKLRENYKNKIIEFLKKEYSEGRYPNCNDVGKMLKIGHIWNYFDMTELYRRSGVPTYRERETRK